MGVFLGVIIGVCIQVGMHIMFNVGMYEAMWVSVPVGSFCGMVLSALSR